MKERLVTLLLAVGALFLFYALFVPQSKPGAPDTPLPVSTEGRDAGYQGLWRWLQSQQVPVLSFRDRYTALDREALPASGNLLVTTLPQLAPARGDEAVHLDGWLQRGNTLLVMAALNDTPPWAVGGGQEFIETLVRLTGLRFRPRIETPQEADDASIREALQRLVEPAQPTIVPRVAHPLFAGVDSIAARSEFPASRWVVRESTQVALELADRATSETSGLRPEPAIWLMRRGQGQVIVVAFASPFSNAVLGTADNARLFANIMAWSRSGGGGGGAVIFDDAHQGLVDYYDGKAFFSDPRLHRTLLWLGLLWLLFVLGWQRLRPQADGWQPADVTGFIRVTGEFLADRIAAPQAALRLIANFFNSIRHRLGLPADGEPVWDWLATQASVAEADLQALRRLHARALAGHRIDLIALQNCLTRITGRLS